MDDLDDILERLETYVVAKNGSPAELLRIFRDILDECGEMYADTVEERRAVNEVAIRLRNMVCSSDEEIDRRLRSMTELLTLWYQAEYENLPFPYVDVQELEDMRRERNALERRISELEGIVSEKEAQLSEKEKENRRLREGHADRNTSQTEGGFGYAQPTGYAEDPFQSIPNYEVVQLDLSAGDWIPTDKAHLCIRKLKRDGVVAKNTFYYQDELQTVEFACPVDRIDENAFHHEGSLALKFRNGTCKIDPDAFSIGTRLVGITAPRGSGEDTWETYARKHNIPFYPSE